MKLLAPDAERSDRAPTTGAAAPLNARITGSTDAGLSAADLATMPGLLLAAARPGTIDLAMGFDPDPPPDAMCAAVIDVMRGGVHHYVDSRGLAELRRSWARHIADVGGAPVDPDHELTITTGASGGVFCALMALGCVDREVVVLDPGYALHRKAIGVVGGRLVTVKRSDTGWGIDLDRLEAALRRRPRAMLLVNPCNPTGALTGPSALGEIVRLCAANDVALVVDETYAELVFDGPPPCAWRLRATGLELVVVRSLSKSHRASGWRIGATLASPELTERLRAVNTVTTLSVPAPLQYGALGAFGAGRDHLPGLRGSLSAGHDRIVAALRALGARVTPAAGGMFVCADVAATAAATDIDFVQWLHTASGLLVAPGRLFFGDADLGRRHVRVCFARRSEVLDAAIAQLDRLIGADPGRGV